MSVQTIADTIILIGNEYKQNNIVKAEINYMSSLLYQKKPYQPKMENFQFESLESPYLTQVLFQLIDEKKVLLKEHAKLCEVFVEEDYK